MTYQGDPARTDNATLVAALHILAEDIQSEDGVANAVVAEAADRIDELNTLMICAKIVLENNEPSRDIHNRALGFLRENE